MPHRVYTSPGDCSTELKDQWLGRDAQIDQLHSLLNPEFPSPSCLVVYGPEATGKSALVDAYLKASNTLHAIVQCQECITSRHLFERAVYASENAISDTTETTVTSRCESPNAFAAALARVLTPTDKFVLVLDGVDEQRDAVPTLLAALPRIAEMSCQIESLTMILIVRHSEPHMLHTRGIPHVHFSPYDETRAIAILAKQPPATSSEHISADDVSWLWGQYLTVIWNSLAKSVARDLVSFCNLANSLWFPFISPVLQGTFGPRDVSRLVVAQTRLLQDESVLSQSMLGKCDSDETNSRHELPYYSQWLLCAAYLASFNPSRQDEVYFRKSSERKRKRKGGGTVASRKSSSRKVPRRLLSPSPFALDRLLAILHAIVPHDMSSTIDTHAQLATLTSLRLLVKSAVFDADLLAPAARWKANFGLDYAMKLAKALSFDISDYVAE